MAAGFTLKRGMLPEFINFMNSKLGEQIRNRNIVPSLMIDDFIQVGGVNTELISDLQRLAPYGAGNPEPRFVLPKVILKWSKIVGSNHVSCKIQDMLGNSLNGIAFRCVGTPLADLLINSVGVTVDVAGKLRINTWHGTSTPQIVIDDVSRIY